ncbi:galactose-1-phosphate uridylyltransferase [Arthrobacter sp. efr-133-TYG-104]|uniref:galactose-1-phosphate uridylyltransferase n=1 Tax=Arthrobacter sp. efr-133-TYG-104 TaxID=3040324 RepID=UPI00254A7C0D|nr:galactose-1-phosphate uridylyltransferase [Arthrobacter sp. efr-133-TYG-104]
MSRITSTRLADSRELIYFDDPATPVREPGSLVDHRPLPSRGEPGEVRYDALSGDWVAVAAHRQSRTHLPPADQCPLCPTTAANPSEIPAPDYDVVVFENRFPSLGPTAGEVPELPTVHRHGIKGAAHGRCEVIAFTPEHTGAFAKLSETRARTVIEAWAQRTEALSGLPGVQQVFPFENRGADIGVTLHHPHGQIYAYPYLAPRAAQLGAVARKYYDDVDAKETLAASLLKAEREDGSRMILEGNHFSAYVPFAARWPLEVHLVPHRSVPDLAGLTGEERDELATVYLDLLNRLDALYPTPMPYISAWYQAPLDPALRPAGQLHLQLTSPRRAADKLKYLAGSEAAMGAFINDTTPEAVAERLRSVAPGSVAPGSAAPGSAAPTQTISTTLEGSSA